MKRNSTKILSFLLTIILAFNFLMPINVSATDQQIPDEYIPPESTVEESVEAFKEPKDPVKLQQELDFTLLHYSVADTDGSATDRAVIDSESGLLTAQKYGKIQLRVSYPGAPWTWYWYVSIGGTFVGEVPTSLRSNDSHLCIPCAVTNIASFWCVSEQLTQYNCETAQELENRAQEVQAAMGKAGSYMANANIQYGYNIFSHTENGLTYKLNSVNCWASKNQFDWNSIVNEINAGRPVMLGFASGNGSPYGSHMTVCVGYSVVNGTRYVYLSDSHNDGYIRQPFNEVYNDFISKVTLITD